MKAKIIRVKIEEGRTGLFFATSPDMKGLLVAEKTLEKMETAVPEAIRDLYAACDMEVVVSRLENGGDAFEPWVAFPASIARMALESTN
jgi:hypothetical protein